MLCLLVGLSIGLSVTKTKSEHFLAIPLLPTRPRLGGSEYGLVYQIRNFGLYKVGDPLHPITLRIPNLPSDCEKSLVDGVKKRDSEASFFKEVTVDRQTIFVHLTVGPILSAFRHSLFHH